MALRPCRECHQLVSQEAGSCPHCGVRRPVVAEGFDTGLSGLRGIVVLTSILLMAEIAAFRYQMKQLTEPPPPAAGAAVDSFPGYWTLSRGVWLGARLYDRETRAYIGRIISLDCPDPTPRGSGWRCAQVDFADGHTGWVRRPAAERHYLAKRPY